MSALIIVAMPLIDWCLKKWNFCHRKKSCKCRRHKKITPENDAKGSQNERDSGILPPELKAGATFMTDMDAP